ncbi:hypothetical protein M404DRAFT_997050 [Pisolithus tinctorius Marx 270]|uniref:Uncharacterized protein n=1 Tax=Pisolithus tinctorius Marx 270 TaxID=870435 RepID=A0A0C3PKT7_PISTI|nr:hypothetical protein M404DRAFT_997050 [Pisolithus tinctorius Marx 270]
MTAHSSPLLSEACLVLRPHRASVTIIITSRGARFLFLENLRDLSEFRLAWWERTPRS